MAPRCDREELAHGHVMRNMTIMMIVYIKEVSNKHDEHEDAEHLMVIVKVRVTVVVTGKIVLKRG